MLKARPRWPEPYSGSIFTITSVPHSSFQLGVSSACIRSAERQDLWPRACVRGSEVEPGPGLTLVVGRNGSGKSSFAEGIEVALTGHNERL